MFTKFPLLRFSLQIPFFFLLELVLLVAGNVLYAQKANHIFENIKFLPVEGNLSEGTVTSMVQDYKGFLWFGTRNGLNRYNGVSFSVYEHIFDDSTSLSNSYINFLFEDSRRNLWIGTKDGLNLYDRNEDTFTHFQHNPDNSLSISHNTVYVIFEDSNYHLWIGTEGGLNRYNPGKGTFSRYTHDKKDPYSLAHNYVNSIFEDSHGNMWVGTYGGGLDLFDSENNRFIHHQFDASDKSSISSNYIRVAYKDYDGDVWIGTKGGLNLLTENEGCVKFKRFLRDKSDKNSISHHVIAAINQDNSGNLWFGTENGGLSIYNKQHNSFTHYSHDPLNPNSIGSNSIWSIYKDNVGTMWMGLLNRGLNKWDKYQSKFNHYNINFSENSLNNGNITCFWEEDEGGLWVGTDGGGLNFFDRKSQKFTHYVHDPMDEYSLGSNAIIAIYEDSHNNLWVGTWGGGLNLFDRKNKQFRRFIHDPSDPSSINSDNIFSILEDSQGRLWVGVFEGGLDLYDRNTGTFSHFEHDPDDPNSLAHNKVFKIFEDSQQNLWIGTEGGGLSLLHMDDNGEVTFTNYQNDPGDSTSLSGDVIITITEDRQQNLWIGTFGDGLNRFNKENKTFKTYRKADGLPNNVIHGILEDNEGHLWISTNDGVSDFDPEKEAFRNYSKADGLQSQEFIRGSYLKAKSGELFFGGVNGFNSFYPCEVTDNPNIPPVYITDFSIYGKQVKPGQKNSPLKKDISDTREIILSNDQNVFSFEISALNYSQASENQYAYKLEGYDNEWQYSGTRRNIYYTKVPQGNYTLKVKGSNNDNIWNEKGASIEVTVEAPWYATGWAYSLYFLMGASIFYFYRRNLIHRERLKNTLKLEQLELTKMQEIDQMKSYFFANISHEFRTPLTLILGPLKSIYSGNFEGNFKGQLKIMIRNADRLLRLVNQLLDLSKLGAGNMKLKAAKLDVIYFMKPIISSFSSYAQKQHIQLSFNCPYKPLEIYFDPDKLEKILVNLITNALKFTKEQGEIKIEVSTVKGDQKAEKSLQVHDNYILLQVSDNGIGIAEEEINHIFDRFYQVNTMHHADIKGTGIGLSLTKELVELHKGYIRVESDLNAGSVFKVYLPMGKEHLNENEIVEPHSLSETSLEDLSYLSFEDDHKISSKRESLNKKGKGDLPLVLLVEDNEDLRDYIARHLNIYCRIIEAVDGCKGFDSAVEKLPDLIISDVMMPGMDGYAFCKKIKSDARTSHIPVILLSAKASSENQIEGFETGADDYMSKPFNAKLLELKVMNIIKSRESLREHFIKNKTYSQLEPKRINVISADEKFLEDALECIEKNMSNSEFGVEDFGKEIGLSRMQLYRKLKALTGQSANEFIRSIRLKRAAQLLETGQLTIAEVTYDVGFNDLKYFRDCFKKQFGVTPSQFGSHSAINNKDK